MRRSMSSIKRDVKKKLRLDRRARFFLEIQPTVVSQRGEVWLVVHSRRVSLLMVQCHRVRKSGKQAGCFAGNHGSIRGSWPMAISGYPRGHNVKWVTRCQSTRGRISLTDTPLEPSISRTRPTTTREISQRWKAFLHRRCSSCLSRQVLWIETHSFLPHR
jgi:hypothetical protein